MKLAIPAVQILMLANQLAFQMPYAIILAITKPSMVDIAGFTQIARHLEMNALELGAVQGAHMSLRLMVIITTYAHG